MHKGASTSPQIRSYCIVTKVKVQAQREVTLDSPYPSTTKVSRSDELCRKLQIPGKSNCLKVVLSCKNFQLDGGGCHPSNSSMDRYL
ncbi:hypothetical protein KY290_033261 [Solanum tuberosum]|uniref:Uncharacterized protein n=1 Tax=Solanum tuberosum TaxID=4113 RepID=A0ABQ7U0D8_SOLTU|nr:hypothetical protein KY289_032630 [Solanum tuberosum]KAH0647270.1 hypothetical protein KY285_032518 [Solanum tuberosum]KAH0740218.1 hypothetical protein KY290_033261 [Solanum tuberosum]